MFQLLIQILFGGFLFCSTLALGRNGEGPLSWFDQIKYFRIGHEVSYVAQQGTVDLRDLGPNEVWHVGGEALLVKDRWLSPHYLGEEAWTSLLKSSDVLRQKFQVGFQNSLSDDPHLTKGTFLLRFRTDRARTLMFAHIKKYHSARIYLVTSEGAQEVVNFGNLGEEPARWANGRLGSPYLVKSQGDFYLYIYVESPPLRSKGSLTLGRFLLGEVQTLEKMLFYDNFFRFLIAGIFMAIFLFYLGIFAFRRRDLNSLYLALFSAFSLAFVLLRIQEGIAFHQLQPVLTGANLLAIACLALYLFAKILEIKPQRWARIWRFCTLLWYGVVIITFALSPKLSQITIALNMLNNLSLVVVSMFLCVRYKPPGMIFLLAGLASILIIQYDLVRALPYPETIELGQQVILGNLMMALAMALVNAKDFAVTYERVVEQSEVNKKLLRELKDQEQARTLFFQNTSHELRTPLNGMIGFLDLIRKGHYGEIPVLAQQQVNKVLSLSLSLKQQVNTILDLAKSKRGELKLEVSAFSLTEMLQEADQLAQGLCLKSPLLSYSSRWEGENSVFAGDKDKIFTILRNLLGNAFKFWDGSRPNHVELSLKREGHNLHIEVRDTGIGIPEEFRIKIFEEFGQVDRDARRAFEGTGLGLTMVQSLTQLMQGNVALSSQVGEGSCFAVTLPESTGPLISRVAPEEAISLSSQVSRVEDQKAVTRSPKQKPAKAYGSILIVDDNPTNCELIAAILDGDGLRTQTALSGHQGLEAMRREPPALLLLDMMMPGLSGEDVLQAMKEDPLLQEIPVILITARASEEDRIFGLGLGADDYLPKPIFTDELRLRVHNMLERHSLLREVERVHHQEALVQLGEMFQDLSHELKNILYAGVGSIKPLDQQPLKILLSVFTLSDSAKEALSQSLVRPPRSRGLEQRELLLRSFLSPASDYILSLLLLDLVTLEMEAEVLLVLWQEILTVPSDEWYFLQTLLRLYLSYAMAHGQLISCSDLTLSVLQLTRSQESPQRLSLSILWGSCFPLVEKRLRHNQVTVTFDWGDHTAIISSSSLTRVWVNLVLNALDAMKSVSQKDPWIHLVAWADDEKTGIDVSNAGAPLSPEIQTQLFRRGFSTKGESGNGLGLYHSRRLMQQAGGDLLYVTDAPHPCFRIICKR